jgi:hypothetical protein
MGVTDIGARVIKVFGTLFGVHLEYARAEASRDMGRVLAGALLLLGGALLFGAAALMLSGAAVFALHTYTQLDWLGALLLVGAIDSGLGGLLLVVGRGRLRGPIMKETRGMVKKTVSALREA